MTNLQLAEPPVASFDGSLDVINIWHTIQGEGPFVGTPAVFVRLAGCNLACTLCDTQYTEGRQDRSVDEIIELVNRAAGPGNPTTLVVLTGGEPLRQNIGPLIRALLKKDWRVQIETNGTLFQEDVPYPLITTVCSPKTRIVHPKLRPHISAYKYVMEATAVDSTDGLPTSVLGADIRPARPIDRSIPIYLQPADSGDEATNQQNRAAVVQSCLRYGYILSLQTHKLLGLE